MAKLDVYNITGEKIREEEVSATLFESSIKEYLFHDVVRAYLAALRRGTASTKGRSEVKGSGAKPWRQKGTGRARAGHKRSPIWRGGGIVFGPKPRDYAFKINRKIKRQAVISAFSLKYKEGNIILLDKLALPSSKTREFVNLIENLNINGSKLLVITDKSNRNVYLSGRNIPYVNFNFLESVVCYDILNCQLLLFDVETCRVLEKTFG